MWKNPAMVHLLSYKILYKVQLYMNIQRNPEHQQKSLETTGPVYGVVS